MNNSGQDELNVVMVSNLVSTSLDSTLLKQVPDQFIFWRLYWYSLLILYKVFNVILGVLYIKYDLISEYIIGLSCIKRVRDIKNFPHIILYLVDLVLVLVLLDGDGWFYIIGDTIELRSLILSSVILDITLLLYLLVAKLTIKHRAPPVLNVSQ